MIRPLRRLAQEARQRRGGEEERVHAVLGAVLRELLEVPELADRHPEHRDQAAVLELKLAVQVYMWKVVQALSSSATQIHFLMQ